MKTAKEALATHLGWSTSDLTEYRYQPTKYTKAIYSVGDDYYTSVKDKKDLPRYKGGEDTMKWEEVPDSYVNRSGWKIFKHTTR